MGAGDGVTEERYVGEAERPGISVRVLAWVAAAALFVGLRIAAAFTLPVFGAELDGLSGAWRASNGDGDFRFIPTLFQGVTAALLAFDDNELWPRLLAVVAVATVPLAIYRMRSFLGEAGAFVALLLLAINPIGIAMSSTANAMAFDEPVAVWLFVYLWGRSRKPVPSALAGLAITLCGPAPLLVGAAWLVTNRDWSAWRSIPVLAAVAGAVAGVVLASARFGLGFDEIVVPPFDLLAAGTERPWSTASAGELVLLYVAPLLVAMPLAFVAHGLGVLPRMPAQLWTWFGFAGGWWLLSLWGETPAPAAAVTLPAVLLLAPAAAGALAAALRVDWRVAAAGIALFAAMFILAGAVTVDWARLERVGDAEDKALVVIFAIGALGAVAGLIYGRAAAALALPATLATVAMLLAGASRVATGANTEPIISPQHAELARELRDRALAAAELSGGEIVVHPDLAAGVVWPFRDSGVLHISSRVGPNAAFVLWPIDLPPPADMEALSGDWALTRTVRTPTADTLDYLHWLVDRNMLAPGPERIAVYSRIDP
jgi:hypothetical protein